MRFTKNLPPKHALDMKRHRQEFFRQVLPIFLITLIVVGVILLFFLPSQGLELTAPTIRDDFEINRVGLLLADGDAPFDARYAMISPIERARAPLAPRLDMPMGTEQGGFTYNAQPFLTDRHLGDDLNGIGGWNSDLGDPVYAVGAGEIIYAGKPSPGWGNVVVIQHRMANGQIYETFYGHLDTIRLPVGYVVKRSEKIGTVGTADGTYLAHLHLELREHGTLDAGAGYADSELGRRSAERFLSMRRNAPADQLNFPLTPKKTESGDLPPLDVKTL